MQKAALMNNLPSFSVFLGFCLGAPMLPRGAEFAFLPNLPGYLVRNSPDFVWNRFGPWSSTVFIESGKTGTYLPRRILLTQKTIRKLFNSPVAA
jgi:hypothetical protein